MIETKTNDNAVVINISENIITENISSFEEEIENVKSSNFKYYIFDFSGVEYVCSSGLGILANVIRLSYETSAEVYFCALTEELKNLFEITKFLTMVKEASSVSEALRNVE